MYKWQFTLELIELMEIIYARIQNECPRPISTLGHSALLGDLCTGSMRDILVSVSHLIWGAFILLLRFQFHQKEAWRKKIIQFFSHFTLSVNLTPAKEKLKMKILSLFTKLIVMDA